MFDVLGAVVIIPGIGFLFAGTMVFVLAKLGLLKQILLFLNFSSESGIVGLGFYFMLFSILFLVGCGLGFLIVKKLRI